MSNIMMRTLQNDNQSKFCHDIIIVIVLKYKCDDKTHKSARTFTFKNSDMHLKKSAFVKSDKNDNHNSRKFPSEFKKVIDILNQWFI